MTMVPAGQPDHAVAPDNLMASRLQLPPGDWFTVLDCLCERFPAIPRDQWLARMARGRVQDAAGLPLQPTHPHRTGLEIRYFREVEAERVIPFHETIVHVDRHLLVVDKPHFLPVVPAGAHVEQTLLARLRRRYDNPDLVPLHRLDRATAGLVMFSLDRASRARYQALFREGRIGKTYEAIAPALPNLAFPLARRSRLVRGEPFFRMQEVGGEPNSETRIAVIERHALDWRYQLQAISGKKHQLRVHMAALGAAIINDDYYPGFSATPAEPDFARPLKLLARRLAFDDPLTGAPRDFASTRTL